MKPSTRREFLATLTSASLGAVAAPFLTADPTSQPQPIRIGCIGTGGRCRRLMTALHSIPGVQLVAVCDIWQHHLHEGAKLAAPDAFQTGDYQQLLSRNDVDAVVIGTPDHLHAPVTIAACAAGKDVYVEKPLTHSLEEGKPVIDAQIASGSIVQVGMQQRSMPHIQEAREIIRSGLLGQVLKIHLTWNRNSPPGRPTPMGIDPATVDWPAFLGSAPNQPFNEQRFRNWRWFWDFGGGLFTDLMVHWIDVAHWILDLDQPLFATSIGDHVSAKGFWETPDTVQTLLQYARPGGGPNIQAYFEGTFSNARNAAMIEFMGTHATLYLDRGRYEIHPEPNSSVNYTEQILGSGPRGADFYNNPDGELLHMENWINAIRTRQQPSAPIPDGVRSAASAHMANEGLRPNR